MTKNTANHECDLFLMSSHHAYIADRILPQFAIRGQGNIHGWGIGTYSNGKATVIRSADLVYNYDSEGGTLNREFAEAVKTASSPIIIGHLRLACSGSVQPQNNHPFKLNFMGYDWLLIHNGIASDGVTLVHHDDYLLPESDSDTPRIFEFMKSRIEEYCLHDPQKSLIEACRYAFIKLIEIDKWGGFNSFFLTDI